MAKKKIDSRPLEVIEDSLNDIVWSDHDIALRNITTDYERGIISKDVFDQETKKIYDKAKRGEEESRKRALKMKGIPDDEWW